MRPLLMILACVMAAPVLAQTRDEQLGPQAFADATAAQARAHSVTLDSAYAARLVGQAAAKVNSLPAEYRFEFTLRIQWLNHFLGEASKDHARGDSYKALADGQYKVIKARVEAGQWLGVLDAAIQCKVRYNIAWDALYEAGYGYGWCAQEARDIMRDVDDLLSMIEAFEDFYGN